MKPTILSIFGTRPEAVKMAPVLKALEKQANSATSIVCFTGQHREMVMPILDLFQIQPDYDLDVMRPDQSLAGLTARLLDGLDPIVREIQPDWILAQGDTTTVMVSALVAYYHQRRFGHIEAGLRTDDKYRPFPEEGNRLIADRMADLCFAPTETARQRLLQENIPDKRILVTGNTVVDALLEISDRPYTSPNPALQQVNEGKRLVLVTAHRRESFGEPFRQLCEALIEIARKFEDVVLVYPVHLNPNVQKPVYEMLSRVDNIVLQEPLAYPDLIQMMRHASLIMTDSGGIQEEAPTFKVPLLVMRDTTERPEGVEAGVARLVGTNKDRIVAEASRILSDPDAAKQMQGENPYGDGQAAQRIVEYLLRGAHD